MEVEKLSFKKVISPFHVFKGLYPEADGSFTSPIFNSKYVIGEQYKTIENIEAIQLIFTNYYSLGEGLFYGFTSVGSLFDYCEIYEKYYGRKDNELFYCLFLVPEGSVVILNEHGEIGTNTFKFIGTVSETDSSEIIRFTEDKVEFSAYDITSRFGTWSIMGRNVEENGTKINLKIFY